jgi:catechol 2,3-dioxygenase-like lactoylglutathione lyase family enzyme
MHLLDHISITVRDLDRSRAFYIEIMAALGAGIVYEREDAIGFGQRNRTGDDGHTYLSVFRSGEAVPDPRRHWCFRADSSERVRAFHRAGLAAGGQDAGPPGLRPHYHAQYYAAFLLDPEGNKVEAVFHRGEE